MHSTSRLLVLRLACGRLRQVRSSGLPNAVATDAVKARQTETASVSYDSQ